MMFRQAFYFAIAQLTLYRELRSIIEFWLNLGPPDGV